MKQFTRWTAVLLLVGLMASPSFAPVGADVDISVTKLAEDAEGVLFPFSGENFDGFFDFDLYAGESEYWAFSTAHKNTFEVIEFVPDGWMLTDILVETSDPAHCWGDIDLPAGSVTLNLSPGVGSYAAFDVTFVNEHIPVIPAPGAILLSTIGVGFIGWLRRRKTL